MRYLFYTIILLLAHSLVFAENYYPVKSSGTRSSGHETYANFSTYDSGFTSEDNADFYGSIGDAESEASGGEWIVVEDGTYTENVIVNGIDGSSGNNTVIRARNDWGATLSPGSNFGFQVQDDYVVVRGFHTGGGVYINGSSYVKVIRCSGDFSGGTWTFISGNGSSYTLFEECFAWGGSHRYMFGQGGASDHVVVRRCLGRWDYSTFGVGYPLAAFANYASSGDGYAAFQNCVAIDGTNNISYTGTYRGIKGFKTPNGAENTTLDGCIVLNFDGTGVMLESGSTNFTINDTVVWDLVQTDGSATYAVAWGIRTYGSDTNFTIANLTMGDNQTDETGLRIGASESGSSLTDSIFYSISGTAVDSGMATQTDNLFYANGDNGTTGSGAITGTDPTSERLLYLPRIETGDQGATLIYRIGNTAPTEDSVGGPIDGLSGLLWGDSGWDTLTSNDLWPYPNEDEIKTQCAAFSMGSGEAYSGSPVMTGARGFAATGETLTKYIWEYLGNTIPDSIYGSDSPGSIPLLN